MRKAPLTSPRPKLPVRVSTRRRARVGVACAAELTQGNYASVSPPAHRFSFGTVPTLLLFQGAWWATAGLVAFGVPWSGPLPMLVFTASLCAITGARRRFAGLVMSSLALGLLVELSLLGSFAISIPASVERTPPLWLLSMWMGFGAALPATGRWLSRHLELASLLGAALGPASYLAGQSLGILEVQGARGVTLIGVAWSIAFPSLLLVSRAFGLMGGLPRGMAESRLSRRLRTLPRLLLGATLVVLGAPVLLFAALLVDGVRYLRRRVPCMTLRVLAFAGVYIVAQWLGLLALAWAWLRAHTFASSRDALVDDTYQVQQRWAAALFAALQSLFRLSVVIEGQEAVTAGPLVLLVRHASIIDTLLPTLFVSRPSGLRLRFVLKEELLEDPCIDVAGLRLPNHFVRRGGAHTAAELEAIGALARGVGPMEGILLYPEGTRYSPRKQRVAIEHIRNDQPALAPLASTFRQVLPPKTAGAFAALDGAPEADLVFLAHRGLEGFSTVRDIWSGALLGKTIRLHLWRIPRGEIPADREGRGRFLYEQWQRVDAFVAKSTREDSLA